MSNRYREEDVMDKLYKYKDAFSLRDKIGIWPNIEVEKDVTEKSPFFIRLYYVKGEDKKHTRQRNENNVLSRYSKGRFFTILKSSNVNQ